MVDRTSGRLRLDLQDRRQSLPLLAVLALLAAAWFGWSGVSQWRERSLAEALQQARGRSVDGVRQVIAAQTRKLDTQVAAPPLQAALRAGDSLAAAMAVKNGWAGIDKVEVFPADLQSAYADASGFGYGKLALLEAAVLRGKAVARVISDARQPRLGVATASAGHLVYASLPISVLGAPLDQAGAPAEGYLALRQNGFTVHQSGDATLSDAAEALAQPVPGSDLRVTAAVPEVEPGPAGLGAIPCLLVAVLLALVAAALLLQASGRLRAPTLALRRRAPVVEDAEPTLAQALQREATPPPPPVPRPVATDEEETPAVTMDGRKGSVDPDIFRAYDIRGVVGQTLDVTTAELIGQAIGSVMADEGLTDIVVGRDGRLSGPELSAGLIRGLRRAGRNVIDIGLAPTPVAYFAAYHLRAGSCVAVTGSHNPPDYNGFKIVVGGQTLSGATITDLYERIRDGRLVTGELGTLQQREVAEDYIQRISGDVQLDRPLKVVVDAGNGVAGGIAPALLEAIGAEVIPLYCDVDGTFPNHHPDPSEPHNLEDLIQTVKRFDADIGLAFDGDGDRLGVVTKEGAVIFPDRLLMLFAADVLERNPGALVIYDVKCTGKLQSWILRHGGTPLMWQTGHSLIKAKMRESSAELAGEMSGHFFFQERWYGFDDGLYSAARLLEILAAREGTPSETLATLPDSISTPEIKVPVEEGTPHAIVQRFVESARFEGARLATIDGLRADWDDGWGLVRASNTTPILVLRFEADNEDALQRIRDAFRAELQKVAPGLKITF